VLLFRVAMLWQQAVVPSLFSFVSALLLLFVSVPLFLYFFFYF
jgi:hypothetical protein